MDACSNFPIVNNWFTVNNFKVGSLRASSTILKTDYSLHSYFVDYQIFCQVKASAFRSLLAICQILTSSDHVTLTARHQQKQNDISRYCHDNGLVEIQSNLKDLLFRRLLNSGFYFFNRIFHIIYVNYVSYVINNMYIIFPYFLKLHLIRRKQFMKIFLTLIILLSLH